MKEIKCMSILSRKQWIALCALIMIGTLLTTTVYGGGKNKMEYLYDNFGNSIPLTLPPQIYNIEVRFSVSLFPVPFDNAVGTNDLRNAITVISFPKGRLEMENHFRSLFGDSIQGGGTFLPVIEPDSIGFGQTRRFLMFNFKKGIHKKIRVFPSIDEKIENVAITDARGKKFIFETEEMDRHSEDHNDCNYFLYLMDLSGDEAKTLKKVNIGQGSIWAVSNNKVFVWHFNKKIMDVYDMNLEQAQHPVSEIVIKHKDKIYFTRIVIHPTLPFAIVYGGGDTPDTIINWGEGRDKTPKPLLEGGTDHFSFSPDGKWVTFKQWISLREDRTYMMPVSERYPNYLGTPILMVKERFNPKGCAWTTNPTGFVADGRKGLYRWELTKEAQESIMGNDADKFATFHDYIVAKDLEKLTKEKKQGLGK